MGKVGKGVLLGVVGVGIGIAGLQMVGQNLRSEFVAQSTAEASAVGSSAPAIAPSSPSIAAASPVAPVLVGETIYEQAIFDAFPAVPLTSRSAKKKAAQAADFISATINSKGHLCARPIEMQKAANGLYGVGCVTRRNGYGRSNYLLNTRTGAVSEI